MFLADTVVQLAYDPGIKPNEDGLPGLSVLKEVMGSVNLFGIIAVAVSAGVWAWGHHSGGHQAEANGKKATCCPQVTPAHAAGYWPRACWPTAPPASSTARNPTNSPQPPPCSA